MSSMKSALRKDKVIAAATKVWNLIREGTLAAKLTHTGWKRQKFSASRLKDHWKCLWQTTMLSALLETGQNVFLREEWQPFVGRRREKHSTQHIQRGPQQCVEECEMWCWHATLPDPSILMIQLLQQWVLKTKMSLNKRKHQPGRWDNSSYFRWYDPIFN